MKDNKLEKKEYAMIGAMACVVIGGLAYWKYDTSHANPSALKAPAGPTKTISAPTPVKALAAAPVSASQASAASPAASQALGPGSASPSHVTPSEARQKALQALAVSPKGAVVEPVVTSKPEPKKDVQKPKANRITPHTTPNTKPSYGHEKRAVAQQEKASWEDGFNRAFRRHDWIEAKAWIESNREEFSNEPLRTYQAYQVFKGLEDEKGVQLWGERVIEHGVTSHIEKVIMQNRKPWMIESSLSEIHSNEELSDEVQWTWLNTAASVGMWEYVRWGLGMEGVSNKQMKELWIDTLKQSQNKDVKHEMKKLRILRGE